jgi:hypothetical protein
MVMSGLICLTSKNEKIVRFTDDDYKCADSATELLSVHVHALSKVLILQVTDAQILTGSVSRHVFFAHVRPSLA